MKSVFILSFIFMFSIQAKVTTKEILKVKDIIWGFDFTDSKTIVANLKDGAIIKYDLETKKVVTLNSPKVTVTGQGGLLDIKYQVVNKVPYVYYTFAKKVKGTVVTALGRAKYASGKLSQHETLFESKIHSSTGRHFGSRLAFVGETLFMTIGDRGERDYAQKLDYHNGKILRLTLEGKPLADNPFVNTKNALPEIWSFGHRNPQGIFYDEETKTLYSCEFGPRGGDELNLIKKGLNYGWPVITYGKEYWGPGIGEEKKKGMEQPIIYWTPSISPSGMTRYTGNKNPKWKGDFFLASLGSTHLHRVRLKNGKVIEEEKLLTNLNERIRQVRTGIDGELYISTDSGKILTVHQ
ncbi:PQQ-dependent sugar dehydrogenase [Halobacteriovorax sp. JY17]|uniref:PQQ-dependent sugar dehydrogenase n=1 Tax=Halobacteriovorax sp. JY17 TaxID=2014617 RepID=UPI000C54EAC4|nr:PQQ-dependent sugar dehydrogenase [Halobacteriovorax sp. JY17]PIK13606.1 MAG: dehydrogenase [Halobacteriovorax sp. JY17]